MSTDQRPAAADIAGARPARRPNRARVWALRLGGLALAGVMCAEAVLRLVFGLGDPPLYILDQQTEYRLKPTQECFHGSKRMLVNSVSMRSEEAGLKRSDPSQLRVLVLGDSIVNAGRKLDQAALATELARPLLKQRLGRDVWIGNASAGSWGPVNQLGYVKAFGLFEADAVVIVLNSMDSEDVPGIEAIGPQWPTRRPLAALDEAISNVGLRTLWRFTGGGPRPARTADAARVAAECAAALSDLHALIKGAGALPVAVLYQTRPELTGVPHAGHSRLGSALRTKGWRVTDAGPAFSAALARGEDLFLPGDAVHASEAGQRALAGVIADAVVDALAAPDQGG